MAKKILAIFGGATFLYGISRAVLIFLVPPYISDTYYYQQLGFSTVVGGLWPFLDFPFEYPPLAFFPILLPAWFQSLLGDTSLVVYRILFALTLLPLDWLVFRRFNHRMPQDGAAYWYVLFTSLFPLLIFDRLDLIVGLLVAWPFLSSVSARSEGDRGFAWSWALGGAFKLVPFLLLPLRFCDRSEPWTKERRARLVAPAVVLCLLLFGLTTALGDLPFISQHANRGVQIESVVGSAAMVAGAKVVHNFGGQHVEGSIAWRIAGKLLFWGGLMATLLVLLSLGLDGAIDSLVAAWLLLLGFVVLGYVLSPQFLLWLIPLAPLVAGALAGRRRWAFLLLFAAIVAGTTLHFFFYWDYVEGKPASLALLCGRNVGLLLLWGLSWWWLPRRSSAAAKALV